MALKLVLENGKVFHGDAFGCEEEQIGEIFFHTSMVGYQDLLSDPSYFGKIVCMTYPLIGNYGLTDDDYDFKNIFIKGYVVKENNDSPSNFRSTRILSEAMQENHVTGISDIDTRELTKIIRDEGMMKAIITDENTSTEECLNKIKNYQEDIHPVSIVSCKKLWYSRTANPTHSIVIVDLGIKTTLVKKINEHGLNIVVVPYNSSLETIKKLKPNGVIISHGPGNPNDLQIAIDLINKLKGKYPLLGLGLGGQLIALSYGLKVEKMKHGHQGSNQPVMNLLTGKIDITAQNHFYNIIYEENSKLKLTHKNVVDNDVEGLEDVENKIIISQTTPQDTLDENENIIKRFIKLMK